MLLDCVGRLISASRSGRLCQKAGKKVGFRGRRLGSPRFSMAEANMIAVYSVTESGLSSRNFYPELFERS